MPSWKSLMRGYGYEPFTLEGDDPATMHQQAAAVFDTMLDRIAEIQKIAREASAKGLTPGASGVADAHSAHAQRLDRTEVCGRQAGGEYLARAPGASERAARKTRPPEDAGRVDAQLQTRGAVRRQGQAARRSGGDCAQGPVAHGYECSRQRRPAVAAAEGAELPRFRGEDRRARRRRMWNRRAFWGACCMR